MLLFVDGGCFECTGETDALAEALCAQDRVTVDPELTNSNAAITLLAQLFNQGSIAFEGED